MIDVLLEMGIQSNTKLQLISVDANSNKFKINGVDLSLVSDGIKMKGKVYGFSLGFVMFITR